MRRLYASLGILALLFLATIFNTYFLKQITNDLTGLLTRAEARAEVGDWAAARKLTAQADALWHDHNLYFHIFLRHSDTDDVEIQFREVQGFLQAEEQGEYSASNARLVTEISLLYEAEQFSIQNIL